MRHKAVITAVADNGRRGKARLLSEESNCSGCAAAFLCNDGGALVDVDSPELSLRQGEIVELSVSLSLRRQAVMLMLALPCVVMLAVTLAGIYLAEISEGFSALLGLCALIISFILLYFFIPQKFHSLTIAEPAAKAYAASDSASKSPEI